MSVECFFFWRIQTGSPAKRYINKTNEHQEFPKRLNPQVRLQAKP